MKKIVFALLTVIGFTTANAQDHSILLYGNVGVTSVKDSTKGNAMSWHANPGVGYQINKHITVGVELGWAQTSYKPNGGDRATTNNYNAGVFVRGYHYMGNSHFYCFSHLGLGYQGQYSTEGSHPATDKFSGMYVSLTPNIGYMFGHGFSAYASYGSIGYNTLKPADATFNNPNKNPTNTFVFSFGNDFQFGVSKNFSCHGAHMHHHHDANSEMHSGVDSKDDADDDGDKPMKKKKHHKKDNDKDGDE